MASWAENKRLFSVKPEAKSFAFCFNFSFLNQIKRFGDLANRQQPLD